MISFSNSNFCNRTLWKTSVLQFFIPILLVMVLLAQATCQEAIPEKTLKILKGGTVFVRVEMGQESTSGSGFLIKKNEKFAFIITNEHVVRQRGLNERTITVDFFSGTKNKKSFAAKVVGEDESRDLAVLIIENDDLPEPIKIESSTEIRETQSVYILGFPFGEALATSRLGPNVTIARGTISSIRTDDSGVIERVQVDGDINPGNSGGPIVFTDGTMMGVSVSTVIGTQIGMGIPRESVSNMLAGRVGALGISQKSLAPQKTICTLNAELIDPLEVVERVSFLYIMADQVSKDDLAPNESGVWSQVSDQMESAQLDINKQIASGKATFVGDYGERIKIVHQVKFVNGQGKTFFTSPGIYTVKIPARAVAKPQTKPKPQTKKPNSDIAKEKPKLEKNVEEGWLGEKKNAEKENGWLGRDTNRLGKNLDIQPTESNTSVRGEEFRCLDADCQRLTLSPDGVVANLIWDANHEHFFMLNNKGVLRKISFPELVETRTIDLATECSWIEMSKEGICILNGGSQDMVIIDPETLDPIRKFAIGNPHRFTTSPGSSRAYVADGRQLMLIDLTNGKQLRSFQTNDFIGEGNRPLIHEFNGPAMTPDGNYLFCVNMGGLVRYRVDGENLVLEERGPRIAGNYTSILISSDSKYVALPSGGGNGKGYTTHVYSIQDLKERVIEVKGGPYPRTLGYDKAAGMIYSHSHGTELITFNGNGVLLKSYDLSPRKSGDTRQLLVHPGGRQIIVLAGPKMIVVRLPE